jgi:twitching motility protein PilT
MSANTDNKNESAVLPVNFTGTTGRGQALLTVPHQITANSSLNEILIFARSKNASDVHIGALKPIVFRQFGQLVNITAGSLNADQISSLITATVPQDILHVFEKTGDAEYVHTINGYGRFRMAIMKQRNGWDLTARLIPLDIPKFENTGMPASCAALTKWAQGMVLITGPAGCGKTTTLAVLIEMINQTRHDHILSIEKPIEIVYEPKQCQITQREIDIHSLSQSSALRAALREDPDILVVSELRDLDSIQLAVTAAETGHLVFGTMNTVDAAQTVSSVIDSFPAEEQSIVRNMISESLRGVICQQLIPKKDGTGMVPAYEVLIVTSSVANLIRTSKISQINNAITTSRAIGMVLMDNSLIDLANKGLISTKEACDRATNSATMSQSVASVTVPKVKFFETGPNKERILKDLVLFGILEEVSETHVRLKPNAEYLNEESVRKIAKTDFDRIWVLLKQMSS